jgi:general secretion pathway protein D
MENRLKTVSFFTGALTVLLALTSLGYAAPKSVVRDTAIISENVDVGASPRISAARPAPAQDSVVVFPQEQRAEGSAGIYINAESQRERLPKAEKDSGSKRDVVVDFVGADLRDVSKAILGDMLGLNYVVAPNVQGTVTIKINRPMAKEEILPAIGAAFRMSGAAIVERDGLTKVVPAAEAFRESSSPALSRRMRNGDFGLQIVPLRYVGTEEMRKMLEPISSPGGVIPVEATRNVLLLAGSEAERTAMSELIETFDVDWLAGMSVGLFQLKEAPAKAVAAEVWEVLGAQTGPMGKVVQLVPLERLNAIVVLSRQPRYVQEVKNWIDRFDVDQNPNEQKIWVYPVQNGRAATLSDTLSKLVTGSEIKEATETEGKPNASLPDRKRLSSNMRVIADDTTNSLIFMGTKADFVLIEDALKKLDIVPLQVRIEAVVAEVTLTDELRYGIQYLFQKGEFKSILTKTNSVSVSPTLPGFSAFVSGKNISSILDLLQSVTKVNVVSSPQVTILNNQTATLQVGDQVPVATQSSTSTASSSAPIVSTIQMVDTGVILKVTPRVNSSGMVTMDISQEVSDVARTTTSNLDSPTIKQRKIASSIAVRDGETIALGGLITDSNTDGRDGIPILSEIPVLGAVFSSSDETKSRTELLALITPRVIKSDMDVRAVTEDMRRQINAVAPLESKVRER